MIKGSDAFDRRRLEAGINSSNTVSVTDTQSISVFATVAMPCATPAVTFESLTKSSVLFTFTCIVKLPETVVTCPFVVSFDVVAMLLDVVCAVFPKLLVVVLSDNIVASNASAVSFSLVVKVAVVVAVVVEVVVLVTVVVSGSGASSGSVTAMA